MFNDDLITMNTQIDTDRYNVGSIELSKIKVFIFLFYTVYIMILTRK